MRRPSCAVLDTRAAAGAEFWEEDHGAQRSLYFPDPDGVVLEITWPPSTPRTEENPAAVAKLTSVKSLRALSAKQLRH